MLQMRVLAVIVVALGALLSAASPTTWRQERDNIAGLLPTGAAYVAEITIGANKQVVDVLIDTGSFELWVNPNCQKANVPDLCQGFGQYDPSTSISSRKLDGGFSISYGSGKVTGAYYKDDIYVSGARIQAQQFGVANDSDMVWFGIMGLGRNTGTGGYPFLVDSLSAQGLIDTKLFSMDLGGQPLPGAAMTGEIVFGGVDINKYSGFLQRVPTDPRDAHYKIILNSLLHRAPNSSFSRTFIHRDLPLSVIVDSGTTLSLLPESLVKQLAAQFPGAEPDGKDGYTVDCALRQQPGSVDFEFLAERGKGKGKVTINVAYKDFIWDSGGNCFLGAAYSKDVGFWILGDTFMRGVYVAFDQTNNALFMSNYVSCNGGQSNLVAVGKEMNAAGRIFGANSCDVHNGINSDNIEDDHNYSNLDVNINDNNYDNDNNNKFDESNSKPTTKPMATSSTTATSNTLMDTATVVLSSGFVQGYAVSSAISGTAQI
ncbi:aspartic peptidase domain-containing protein [Xylariaceae sp. FL0594]|nr:aspartic peptidase domain-containing protein [Xylariaceae sp. FL0594]